MDKFNTENNWLEEQRARYSASTVEPLEAGFASAGPWEVHPGQATAVSRKDGGFFSIKGLSVSTDGREVSSWEQPFLKETGKGLVVLFCRETTQNVSEVLVQAKFEPGNFYENGKKRVLLAPSVQASESNLNQAHGGKKPLFVDLVDADGLVEMPSDGGRFWEKSNLHGVQHMNHDLASFPDSFRWVPRDWVREKIYTGDVNEHLIKCLPLLLR